MKLVKKALPVVAVSALLLTGCSAGSDITTKAENAAESKLSCAPAGDVVKGLNVGGELGGELTLQIPGPAKVDAQQSLLVRSGSGKKISGSDDLNVVLAVYNGDTSEKLAHERTTVKVSNSSLAVWLQAMLGCAETRSRVVSVVPKALVGDLSKNEAFKSLQDASSMIVVADFLGTAPSEKKPANLLSRAEGTPKPAPEGFPKVTLDDKGAPNIEIPDTVAPEKLEIATLIEGSGDTVQPGDRVWVNYRGVIWRTGEEFDSSWSRGEPISFLTTGVIGGFQKALEGQKVGSQVIAVVPAEDGGYGAEALKQQGHEPNDVMVFVLDILGTNHPE